MGIAKSKSAIINVGGNVFNSSTRNGPDLNQQVQNIFPWIKVQKNIKNDWSMTLNYVSVVEDPMKPTFTKFGVRLLDSLTVSLKTCGNAIGQILFPLNQTKTNLQRVLTLPAVNIQPVWKHRNLESCCLGNVLSIDVKHGLNHVQHLCLFLTVINICHKELE